MRPSRPAVLVISSACCPWSMTAAGVDQAAPARTRSSRAVRHSAYGLRVRSWASRKGTHRRTELFTAYRPVLIYTGADVRGSDQNSLLLRLLEGEEALALLGDELSQVRAREKQLRSALVERRSSLIAELVTCCRTKLAALKSTRPCRLVAVVRPHDVERVVSGTRHVIQVDNAH
ncbi:hypothetical protein ACH4A7_36775 [Streptomyces cyaneofuscatus]|uniref:hypothetical protein n=1 Tax=Streptomyces cyaneofuscatus TaxID=66883 RepID=UPI00379A7AF7